MKLLGKSPQYASIVAYLHDEKAETDLTDHEKALLNRWNEAFTLMRNYKSSADTAAILMKRFPGLSRATAYRDISNAIAMFGNITESTKEGIKHLSTEMVRDAFVIAKAKNNEDAMIKAAVAIAKINGVNITDPDLPDFSKLEPHTYQQILDPVTAKAFQLLIKTGRIDFNMLVEAMQEVAEDAVIIEETKQLPDANS